ncbi:MAG: nuclear transport factor 2 family protein [Cyclobacteriaceae bacterium]|nr:nuclear transport factor 2 family protein [Cyclobacteriaceae bacterium]
MKYLICTAFIILYTAIGGKLAIAQQTSNKSTSEVQKVWLKALQGSESLVSFYTKNSGVLIGDSLYVGWDKIESQIQKVYTWQFENYTSEETFQLRDNQKFELGSYQTRDGKTYSTIIGWRKGAEWKKELEIWYEKTFSGTQEDRVERERGIWEKHSNQHRPDLIVKELASRNGKYFNRGKEYHRDEIASAYSYMNDKSYSIKLTALKVVQVDESTIFDIGTFDVGGKGLYTLIWKKEDGEWKLLLDFNF